jgi:hypothetical protein
MQFHQELIYQIETAFSPLKNIPCRLVPQEYKFCRLENMNQKTFPDPRWLVQRVKEFRRWMMRPALKLIHRAARGGRGLGKGTSWAIDLAGETRSPA